MKRTLFIIALWLISSPESFSQTSSNLNNYLAKDVSMTSAKRLSMPAAMAVEPKAPSATAKPETVAPKPQGTPATKQPSVADHTQNVKSATSVIQANTDAIVANTRALQANTEAMQANLRAGSNNKHLRVEQIQQNIALAKAAAQPQPPVPPIVEPAKAQPVPAAWVAAKPAAAAPVVKPQPAPAVAAVKFPAPMPATTAQQAMKLPMPVAVLPPAMPAEKKTAMGGGETYRTVATMPAAPKSSPVNEYGETYRMISTMPLSASAAKPVASVENKRVVMAMPETLPQYRTVTVSPVTKHDAPRSNRVIGIYDVMQMPLADAKMNDPKTPVAARYGLKDGDVVTTQGYLQVIATEDSAKSTEAYYLQLTLSSGKSDSCLIVKIPTSHFANERNAMFIKELVKGRIPCAGGNTLRKPVYVSVTGKLTYNASRASAMRGAKPAFQGKRDMHSYTPWEISSVSNIEYAMP
ncbi:MAG: hypothetical protein V4649_12275 [Bacteroidota bacterium]